MQVQNLLPRLRLASRLVTVAFLLISQFVPDRSAAGGWFGRAGDRAAMEGPVHRLGTAPAIGEWMLLGPLPNPKAEQPLAPGLGYDKDYLTPLGGEARARLTAADRIPFAGEDATTRTATPRRAAAKPHGVVDLNDIYDMPGRAVAYAFAWVDSPTSQTANWYLGSGDGVKVWVDGKLVHAHSGNPFGQSCIPRQVQFSAGLRKGRNPVLVKVDNANGDWAFILEVADSAGARDIQTELDHAKIHKDFQGDELLADSPTGFVMRPGPFPPLQWKDAPLAEKALGRIRLKIRWFDARLNEVRRADGPGRYAAYAEAPTRGGGRLRRAMTFFCAPPAFVDALEALPTTTTKATIWATTTTLAQFNGDYIPNPMIPRQVWEEQ
ncbi:MAG: hypothetical protein M1457_00035, partial [bacterium]|nr:hypothetical protein [bacterium]